jgi:hypothetical protein
LLVEDFVEGAKIVDREGEREVVEEEVGEA